MASDPHSAFSTNGTPPPGALPPVEPPSAKFILQLFLIPGILVAVVVAFIWVFFGWIGTGPQTPAEFLAGLKDPSEVKRWKTAQDLAQVLPRNAALRGDPHFALDMAEMLRREMDRPPAPAPQPGDPEASDLLEYLPAAVATFQVPVGYPLLAELVETHAGKTDDRLARRHLRNAVVALGLMGARLKEFDELAQADKDRILAGLKDEAAQSPGSARATWAAAAYDALQAREAGRPAGASGKLPVAAPLGVAARAPDELTRKYAILALANWDDPAVEPVLRRLTGDQSDIPDGGFERPERPFEPADRLRGEREIRLNAALALARRGSPVTPWPLVAEALDETTLRERYYPQNKEMATGWLLKSLRDLRELKRYKPGALEQQPQIVAAVQKLADSPTVAVQVEARRLLGTGGEAAAVPARVSKEVLLIASVGGGVLVLLALAVFARWRRQTAPTAGLPG